MNRILLLIVLSLFLVPSMTRAQKKTFDVVKTDGTYEHFDWSKVSYIDVGADNSVNVMTNDGKITYDNGISGIGFNCQPGNVTASPVGVWEIISMQAASDGSTNNTNQGRNDMQPGDRIQICSNGRIYDEVDEVAVWRKGGPYALSDSEAWLVYFTLKIYELSETRFVFDLSIVDNTITFELKRLSFEDRTDNPYSFDLPDNPDPTEKDYSYFFPCLDFNATSEDVKTYMESNNWVRTEHYSELIHAYKDPTESKEVEYLFHNGDDKIIFADVTYSTYSDDLLEVIINKIKEIYGIELSSSASLYHDTYSSFVTYKYEGIYDLGNGKSIDISITTSKDHDIRIFYWLIRNQE